MKYLLSEKEYRDLRDANEQARRRDEATLLDLCIKVCDHMPIEGWHAPQGEKRPWGCILGVTPQKRSEEGWYCDLCPVSEQCPYQYKRWSK